MACDSCYRKTPLSNRDHYAGFIDWPGSSTLLYHRSHCITQLLGCPLMWLWFVSFGEENTWSKVLLDIFQSRLSLTMNFPMIWVESLKKLVFYALLVSCYTYDDGQHYGERKAGKALGKPWENPWPSPDCWGSFGHLRPETKPAWCRLDPQNEYNDLVNKYEQSIRNLWMTVSCYSDMRFEYNTLCFPLANIIENCWLLDS